MGYPLAETSKCNKCVNWADHVCMRCHSLSVALKTHKSSTCSISYTLTWKTRKYHPSINLVVICKKQGVGVFSKRKHNADVCVGQMHSHVPLRHLRPSLSVIPHSSLCLLPSIRTRTGPTSASSRPDTQTYPADCRDTKWGNFNWDTTREKTGRGRTGRPIAAFSISPNCIDFFFIYHHFSVVIRKEKKICYWWKYVKAHQETKIGHKQRPSEHDQRARHTQLDR